MRNVLIFLMALLFVSFVRASPAPGQDPVRLTILPFQVHSPEDLGYLQKGVADMLASRIAQGGGIRIVENQAADISGMDPARLAALGEEVGADLVVYGSITKLGEHISLDGELVDVSTRTSKAQLTTEAASMDEVIPQVSQLAQQIRTAAIGQGRQVAASTPAKPAKQPATTPDLPQQQIVGGSSEFTLPEPPGGYPTPPGGFTRREAGELFVRSEEEALLDKEKSINPSFIMSYEADKETRGYVKSPHLDLDVIQALDAGDTDGDGLPETVIADKSLVYVYENVMLDEQDRQVIRPTAVWGKVLSLDVADINRNGVAEIYITTMEGEPITSGERVKRERLASQVVEYREGEYRTIVDRLPYFLRVTLSTQHGSILLAQEKRPAPMTDRQSDFLYEPFGKISRLTWKGDELEKAGELPLKDNLCVLGLTMVDVDHDGMDEHLGFDARDYLKLLNSQGGEVWVSSEPYGRTNNYFRRDYGREIAPTEELRNPRVWLPARTLTVDLDRDGFEEIILSHNFEPVSLSTRTRFFTKGAIFSLSWDGVDFMQNWRTREMKGYISDYQVADSDGDGNPELLVGLLQRSGARGFFKAKANLVAFDLKIEKAKREGPGQEKAEETAGLDQETKPGQTKPSVR